MSTTVSQHIKEFQLVLKPPRIPLALYKKDSYKLGTYRDRPSFYPIKNWKSSFKEYELLFESQLFALLFVLPQVHWY
jgi:hypothetical protein